MTIPADPAQVPSSSSSDKQLLPVTRSYQNRRVHAIPFEDEILFLVLEVEAALAYQPKGLSQLVPDWLADQRLRERAHLRKLVGGRLAAFKALIRQHFPDMHIDPHTPALLTLTESGLYRVLLLSGKPDALAFQDWVESEVLPAIRRTGRYEALPAAPALPSEPYISTLPPEFQPLHGLMERFMARGLLEAPVYEALLWQLEQAAPVPLTGPEGAMERVSLLAQLQTLIARAADLPIPCLRAIHRAVSAICGAQPAG